MDIPPALINRPCYRTRAEAVRPFNDKLALSAVVRAAWASCRESRLFELEKIWI